MSSGSSNNAIRIPVEIVLDQTTRQLTTLRRTAETEGKAAASALQTAMTQTEQVAARGAAAMVRQQTSLKESFRGTSQAVAGVQQGLLLLGQRGSPAIGALTTALSGLLANGLNPVALAIGGAAGLVSLFSHLTDRTEEYERRAKSLTEATKDQASAVERLVESMRDLNAARFEGFAERGGTSPEEEALRNEIVGRRADISREEAGRPVNAGDTIEDRIRFQAAQEAYNARLEGMRVGLEAAERTLANLIAARLERGRGSPMAPNVVVPDDPSFLTSGARPFAPIPHVEMSLAERNASAEAMLREMAYASRSRTFAREGVPSRRFSPGPTNFDEAADEIRRIEEATREGTERGLALAAEAPEAKSKLSVGIEDAVTGGIADALTNPSEWQDALASFASALQRAVTTSLAESITGTLGGGGAAGTGLLGLIQTGIGAVAGGGTGEVAPPDVEMTPIFSEPAFAKSYRAGSSEQPIFVAVGVDEASADAIVSKASANGARAVFVRATGGGTGRGSIPPRRRR